MVVMAMCIKFASSLGVESTTGALDAHGFRIGAERATEAARSIIAETHAAVTRTDGEDRERSGPTCDTSAGTFADPLTYQLDAGFGLVH
jgi:hypothetical protein